MNAPSFHVEAKQYVKKLLRIRFGLIRRALSGNPAADHAAQEVNMQLGYFPYDTDLKMASFLTRYEEQLRELIPGSKSKCGERLLPELKKLIVQANEILTNNK